jgi:hypothetical protein
LLLDRYEYTRDEAFLREEVLPVARSVLDYFDTRFSRDEKGALVIAPTQALETHWHDVVDDAPSVAGLHAVLARLRALPSSSEDGAKWNRLAAALPPVPIAEEKGARFLSAAARFDPSYQNGQNGSTPCSRSGCSASERVGSAA